MFPAEKLPRKSFPHIFKQNNHIYKIKQADMDTSHLPVSYLIKKLWLCYFRVLHFFCQGNYCNFFGVYLFRFYNCCFFHIRFLFCQKFIFHNCFFPSRTIPVVCAACCKGICTCCTFRNGNNRCFICTCYFTLCCCCDGSDARSLS